MKVEGKHLTITRGDSATITVSCRDAITGTTIALTEGDTVYFTVKINYTDTGKVFQKVITSFVDGKAVISISPNDTKTKDFGDYVYDIQLNRADGTVTTIIPTNIFTIGSEVTNE